MLFRISRRWHSGRKLAQPRFRRPNFHGKIRPSRVFRFTHSIIIKLTRITVLMSSISPSSITLISSIFVSSSSSNSTLNSISTSSSTLNSISPSGIFLGVINKVTRVSVMATDGVISRTHPPILGMRDLILLVGGRPLDIGPWLTCHRPDVARRRRPRSASRPPPVPPRPTSIPPSFRPERRCRLHPRAIELRRPR